MTPLGSRDLVGIWESGLRLPNWRRALVALAPALPELEPDALSRLSIGRRNAYLFALRQSVFGPAMNAFVKCERCGEPLEFELVISELLDGYEPPSRREFDFVSGEFGVHYRLLTSVDLARAAARGGATKAKDALIASAVLRATRGGAPIAPADLPAAVIESLGDHMAAADPLARVAIALACAACEHVWKAQVDIATFLWAELEVQAKHALADVVTLARHYGWAESEILAMSPARRQFYLGAIE